MVVMGVASRKYRFLENNEIWIKKAGQTTDLSSLHIVIFELSVLATEWERCTWYQQSMIEKRLLKYLHS